MAVRETGPRAGGVISERAAATLGSAELARCTVGLGASRNLESVTRLSGCDLKGRRNGAVVW